MYALKDACLIDGSRGATDVVLCGLLSSRWGALNIMLTKGQDLLIDWRYTGLIYFSRQPKPCNGTAVPFPLQTS
jgi:hypothetical protein